MPQPNDNINSKIDFNDDKIFITEDRNQSDKANKTQKEYPSLYKGYGYKTEKDTEKQLNKIVNDANNATDTTAQKPSINIQGMIDNDHKKQELLEANNNNEQQKFKDISSLFPYQERVIKIILNNLLSANYNLNKNAIIATQPQKDETEDPIMKISNDNDDDNFERAESGDILISCNSSMPLRLLMSKDNFIIQDKEAFEIFIKFIARFAHDAKGFHSFTETFFKKVHNQLEYKLKEGKDKTELQKIINKAIRNKNKFVYTINSESTYGALCFEHMKHIFKDVIRVGGGLFDLKNRRYFDSKGFDTCFARNGQEFILNTELLTRYDKETKSQIPYYKVNTTISAYKALHEAETPYDIIRRCDAIANNPFKDYGIYHEGNKTYFNTFLKPFVRRVNYESDMQGIDLFFHIIKAQYTQSDLEALLNWLAQIAQEPFKKLGYSPFLQGTNGTGKNILLYNLPHYFLTGLRLDIDKNPIFENYCKLVNANTFKDKTNPYMRDCFYIYISEAKDFTIKDMNALKEQINGLEITINQHYKDPDFIPNRINFAFSSNYKNGLKIEANERRYLPIFSKFQSKQDLIDAGYYDNNFQSEYFKECINWLNNQDGYAKLYDYFLKRDVSQVTTRNAPITSSNQEAIESSYEQYTNLLSEYELPDVITACQARALIERKDQYCKSVNRVANALLNLGYEKHPIMKHFARTIPYKKNRYIMYVKNDSVYKNETDKNTLCSLAESFFKEF